jgi:tRNA-splicing ligase RtcB
MKWVKETDSGVPIKSWCEDLEDKALEQATDLARHPVVFRHVALMPDAHMGYGMPIGGVIACKQAVIPYAVGSDIGCGMCAARTDVLVESVTEDNLKAIMGCVRESVPMGVGVEHKTEQRWEGFDEGRVPLVSKVPSLLDKAKVQLGTLGAGNHFIELQAGDDGYLWIMLHSGSRKLGYEVAKHYHNLAVEQCTRWHANIPNKELAFFPLPSQMGSEYLKAMNYCLEYAAENRERMMLRVQEAVASEFDLVRFEDRVNIHHNYAQWEHHFGQNVVVHRKGATSAKDGQKGIIPGSMGTPSYIVMGKGNRDSFESCSHGAGRVMGRKQACRTLTVEECDKAMDGIVFGRWSRDRKGNVDLSEAPGAYKDIEAVIDAQTDLVAVLVKLRPLAAMKG